MNYLRLQSESRWLRLGLAGAMAMTSLAVVSTHSRGGFIALGVTAVMLVWKSRNRFSLLIVIGAAALAVAHWGSSEWRERIETIETAAEEDSSFKGRLVAWQVYLNAALQRPLTGAGLKALEKQEIYSRYLPERLWVDADGTRARAAHSIFFQVAGEVGFVALTVYFGLVVVAWRNAAWVQRRAAHSIESAWMGDLARMGQASIVAFLVGGAALSMAFYDYFFIILVMMAVLRRLLMQQESGEIRTHSGYHRVRAASPPVSRSWA